MDNWHTDSFGKFKSWLSSKGISEYRAEGNIKIIKDLFKREGFVLDALLASKESNLDDIARRLKKKQQSSIFLKISDIISGGRTSHALELFLDFLQYERINKSEDMTTINADNHHHASINIDPGSAFALSENEREVPFVSQKGDNFNSDKVKIEVSDKEALSKTNHSSIPTPQLNNQIDSLKNHASINRKSDYIYEILKAPYLQPADSLDIGKRIVWCPEDRNDPTLLRPIVTNFKKRSFLTPKWEAVTACLLNNLRSDVDYGPIFYNVLKKKLTIDYLRKTISSSTIHMKRPYPLENSIYVNDFDSFNERIEFIRKIAKALSLNRWDFSVECEILERKAEDDIFPRTDRAPKQKTMLDTNRNRNYELVIAIRGKERKIIKLVLDGREVKTASFIECMVEVASHFCEIHDDYLVRILKQDKFGSIYTLVKSTPLVLRRPSKLSKYLFVETDVNSDTVIEFIKLNFMAFAIKPFTIRETKTSEEVYPESSKRPPAANLIQTSKSETIEQITRLTLDGYEVYIDSPWQALKTVVAHFHKKYSEDYLPTLMKEDVNGIYKRLMSISGSRMRKPQMIARELYLELDISSIDAINLIKLHFKAFVKNNTASIMPSSVDYLKEVNRELNSFKSNKPEHDFSQNEDKIITSKKEIIGFKNEKAEFMRSDDTGSPYIKGYEIRISYTGKERILRSLMLDGGLIVVQPAWRALYYVAAHFAQIHGSNYLRKIRENDIDQQYRGIIRDDFKSMVRPNMLAKRVYIETRLTNSVAIELIEFHFKTFALKRDGSQKQLAFKASLSNSHKTKQGSIEQGIVDDGSFLRFHTAKQQFSLSKHKIRIIFKHIDELSGYWELPIRELAHYRIQPPAIGDYWEVKSISGWKLTHILSKLSEIDEKLNPSYRLSKSTLENAEKRIAALFLGNQPLSKTIASVKFSANTVDKETYLLLKHKTRDWQKRAMEAWEDASRKGIVEAATGAGKTALACYCISEFFESHENGLVCVVVPRQPLFDQWNDELHESFPFMPNSKYCYIGNNYDDPLSGKTKLLIIMQQTLVKREDRTYGCKLIRDLKLSGRKVLMVVDEAHHLGAEETVERFVKHIPKEFDTLGLTATPDRRDGAMDEVYPYFSPGLIGPIFSYPLTDAVEDGVLAKVRQYNFKVSLSAEEREEYDGICEQIQNLKKQIINNGIKQVDSRLINAGNLAYLEKILKDLRIIYHKNSDNRTLNLVKKVQSLLQCYINRKRIFNKTQAKWQLLRQLVQEHEWHELFHKGSWIFFHEEIDECERTAKLMEDAFGKSAVRMHHSGIDTEERKEVLNRLNEGGFSILCAVKTLDEGIDIPDLKGVVIVSGSTNKRQQIQRCGRALRTTDSKEYAYLICILSQVDSDEGGERLLIGPITPTQKWQVETITC